MGLHLPKFSNILDDIGNAVSGAAHGIGNVATDVEHGVGAVFSGSPNPQPPVPHLPQGLGAPASFGGIVSGPTTAPFYKQTQQLFHPPQQLPGAVSIPSPNQQPLQTGVAHPPQLQVQTPKTPTGQPLTATVVHTPTLQVGNQQVAQSPTAVSGIKAPAPTGSPLDALEGAGQGIAKAFTGVAQIAPQAVGQLKAITPHPLDPAADKLRQITQTAVNTPLNDYQQLLQRYGFTGINNQPVTQAGQIASKAGNIGTNVALAVQAAPAVVRNIASIPAKARAISDAVSTLPNTARSIGSALQEYRTPLNELGAVGKDVNGADHSPSPAETTPPSGVEPNSGATGGVGQGNTIPLGGNEQFPDSLNPNARLVNRSAEAEQAALGHLQNGGTRDEAMQIYKDATGTSTNDAKFQVQRAAKEAGQTLNPNRGAVNPELANYQFDNVVPGDYQSAASRPGIVNNVLDIHQNNSLKAVKALSPVDKSNFIHYVQGTSDIAKAENPEAVQKAVDTFSKGANVTHALDTNLSGGRTRFIQNYFPDYVDAADPKNQDFLAHKAEQDLEEQFGPEYWRSLSNEEKTQALADYKQQNTLDTGNYSGFRNQQRIFANRKELTAAGLKPLFDNPEEDINRYFNGAKINIGNQSLINAARQADTEAPLVNNSIDLPSGPSFQVSDPAYKVLKQFNKKTSNPVAKAFRGTTSAVVKSIVANPAIHGGNQEFNTVFNTAFRLPGNKAMNAVKLLANQAGIKDVDREAFYKAGNFSPTYGKDQYGFIAKGLQKAGIDPKNAEIAPRAMAKIEENIRIAAFKRGQELGLPQKQVTEAINKSLGGPNLLGDTTQTIGLFTHYLKTNLELLKDAGVEAGKGNFSQATGVAIGLAAWQAGNEAWKKITGNPDAQLRAPGFASTANQLYKGVGQVKNHQVPSIITSHINPLITTGIDELTNRNIKNPLWGGTAVNNNLNGQRTKVALASLVGPAQSIQSVQGQKSTAAESGLGFATGLYTPHAVGRQAAPNIPVLNAKNAKSGNGLAEQKQYYNALDTLQNTVSGDKRATDVVNNYLDRNKTKDGRTIHLTPEESISAAAGVAGNPKAFRAIQQYERSSDSKHDPMWDLKASDLKTFLNYQATRSTDPEKQVKEDLNPNFNSGQGLTNFIKERQQWYQDNPPPPGIHGPAVDAPGTPQYPKFSSQQQSDLDQYGKFTNSKDKANFINAHPELVDSFNALSQYKNALGTAQGGNAQKTSTSLSPDAEKAFNAYNQLPKGTGARTAWIKANPDTWNKITSGLANSAIYQISKEGAKNLYQGEQPSQALLKNVYNAGKYDITKNSDGTYSLGASGDSGSGGFHAGSSGNSATYTSKAIARIRTQPYKQPYFSKNPKLGVKNRKGGVKTAKASKPKTLKVKTARAIV